MGYRDRERDSLYGYGLGRLARIAGRGREWKVNRKSGQGKGEVSRDCEQGKGEVSRDSGLGDGEENRNRRQERPWGGGDTG